MPNDKFALIWSVLCYWLDPNSLHAFSLLILFSDLTQMLRVEATFLSGVFSPLTSAEACWKSSRWLWEEKFINTGVRKPGKTYASPTAML